MRAVIYARYSSENQRDASIEDQVRLCRDFVDRHGWTQTNTYADRALSGASTLRPGYQQLLEDARGGRFDVIVAEALDRLSRDQADVAHLYKQLAFVGITLVTLAEGKVSELHVGLKGTMNALYLKDLADKTGAASGVVSRPAVLPAVFATVTTLSVKLGLTARTPAVVDKSMARKRK
jgi:DNA invertase Pin-like site-specific DNA recombinase